MTKTVMGDSTFRHVYNRMYNLLKNSQAVNQKNMALPKGQGEKSCEIHACTGAWRPSSGYDGRIIAKVLIKQIRQICTPSNLPEFLLLKLLPLSYHHSHFWAATLDFTTFSCCLFLHGPHLFLQLGCFCVDIFMHSYIPIIQMYCHLKFYIQYFSCMGTSYSYV